MAIKLTPNIIIIWVANIILKGIAELADFNFDIDARKAYVQIQLLGESETIEVWLEDFAIISDEGSYQLIIHQAQSTVSGWIIYLRVLQEKPGKFLWYLNLRPKLSLSQNCSKTKGQN